MADFHVSWTMETCPRVDRKTIHLRFAITTVLQAAEKLINGCGYHRRDEELTDAKNAILGL